MLIFDLRWILLLQLTLIGTITVISVWVTHWYVTSRQSTALLRILRPRFEDAPLGILLLADPHHYQYANPYARRLFNLASDHAELPTAVWVLNLQADLQQISLAPQGLYRTVRLAAPIAEQMASEDGQTVRWWVIRWAGINFLFVIDITHQQRAAQQARFLLTDLSHELRTPLATLQTHLAVLQLTAVAEEIRTQSLQIMQDETQRLVRLVNHTLALGRLETEVAREMVELDLRALVEEIVLQMSPAFQAVGANVTIAAATQLPPVFGEPERLKQVLLNLLDNALKYGGRENEVTVTLQSVPDGLLCKVSDSGIGIAAEHLAAIRRRFYRAAPAGIAGNGLGLALVTEILRQHQSQLQIESTVAGSASLTTGTSVSFTLPTTRYGVIL